MVVDLVLLKEPDRSPSAGLLKESDLVQQDGCSEPEIQACSY